ncbi:MAG: nuclear transport factor 2 family protein [Thermoanaerobaculia bacterium]|nr:nuclear transport factor 2 family protein [Thermoanaerobaculia bacterium]
MAIPGVFDDQSEVERVVLDLNQAWLEGRVDDLPAFFHEDVVMQLPRAGGRVEGREAMVESYRQFIEAADIHTFEIAKLQVDVFEGTAVASLEFAITYELGDTIYEETGTDLTVLSLGEEGWQVVWRTQLPSSPS